MRWSSSARCESSAWTSNLISFKSLASSRWYSNSLAEPRAMEQKRANSASPFLPQPSARFAGTEALHRPELAGKAVQLITRERSGGLINRQGQAMRLLPNQQLPEMLHDVYPAANS